MRSVRAASERLRQPKRPQLWQEVVFVAIAYYLYSLVRNGVPEHRATALAHANQVLGLQARLGLGPFELDVNQWVAAHHAIALPADYWYATMHFAVTLGVLVWLWIVHPLRYRVFRTILICTTLIGLVGFWLFPLAPPRMIPGFIDTVVRDHIWGSWGTSGIDSASNQYAAMPSMHIGWSLWCAFAVCVLTRWAWLRVAVWIYPAITFMVIIATGNHFVLDAVGGAAALMIATITVSLLYGRAPWDLGDRADSSPALPPPPASTAEPDDVPLSTVNA